MCCPSCKDLGLSQGCRQGGRTSKQGAKAGRGGRARQGAPARGWHGGREGRRDAQVGEPRDLSMLIADLPGRGCGTCRNSGFNYLHGAAGNQQVGRRCGYTGLGRLGGGAVRA